MTNGDTFRQMNDKELARFLLQVYHWCEYCLVRKDCPLSVRSRSKECYARMEYFLQQKAKDE